MPQTHNLDRNRHKQPVRVFLSVDNIPNLVEKHSGHFELIEQITQATNSGLVEVYITDVFCCELNHLMELLYGEEGNKASKKLQQGCELLLCTPANSERILSFMRTRQLHGNMSLATDLVLAATITNLAAIICSSPRIFEQRGFDTWSIEKLLNYRHLERSFQISSQNGLPIHKLEFIQPPHPIDNNDFFFFTSFSETNLVLLDVPGIIHNLLPLIIYVFLRTTLRTLAQILDKKGR